MDFRNPFNNFWKTFYLNPFEIRPLSGTCTHELNTENKHETDRWARDPTCQSQRERKTPASTARRRRGLRPGQRHHANHIVLANPTVHTRWPMELGGPVTAVHGGMVARVTAGRPPPTMERAMEGCSSTDESWRTRCAC
jgi:hypothetical protein